VKEEKKMLLRALQQQEDQPQCQKWIWQLVLAKKH
jgi:hypothetical protein